MRNTTFTHVHAAALQGLCPAIRNDQLMVHCSRPMACRPSTNPAQLSQCFENSQSGAIVSGRERHFRWGEVYARDSFFQPSYLAAHVGDLLIEVHLGPLLLCGAPLGSLDVTAQIGPNVRKVLGTHRPAVYQLTGMSENQPCQCRRYAGGPIGTVVEVSHGGFHLLREPFPLVRRETEEVSFEVHVSITSDNE